MKLEQYKSIEYKTQDLTFDSITSNKEQIKTKSMSKAGISGYSKKRVMIDLYRTLPYGYIPDEQERREIYFDMLSQPGQAHAQEQIFYLYEPYAEVDARESYEFWSTDPHLELEDNYPDIVTLKEHERHMNQ